MSNKENENKPKITGRIKGYFKGVRAELKKVNWPTKKELTNYTIVVLATVFVMTIVIWGLDIVFESLVGLIV
jgi:preprotein translocase subunit SecE